MNELILNKRCDDDYETCGNFYLKLSSENEIDRISDFILDNYDYCIFDTL
jgi:hypothetical protein